MSTIAWNGQAARPRQPVRRQASASPASPIRLTRRGRVVLASLAAAIALAIGSVAVGAQAGGESEVTFQTVVVAPGDTLWEIAGEVAGDRDVRDVVAMLERVNGLTTTELTVGQVLEVPVQE